jgi:hypothetical protein
MRNTLVVLTLALLLLSTGTQARAAQEQLGKVLLDVQPLGVQVGFDANGNTLAIYKLNLDVSGRIAQTNAISLWLGGEFNVGGRANLAVLEPGLFLTLTMEKLLHVALVPFVRFGFAGGINVYYSNQPIVGVTFTDTTTGTFGFKFGGGLHYFFNPHVGVGAETNFMLGGVFYRDAAGVTTSAFSGYWDLVAGLRFTF